MEVRSQILFVNHPVRKYDNRCVLYEYTFSHTDFIEKYISCRCNICGKSFIKINLAVAHVRYHLRKRKLSFIDLNTGDKTMPAGVTIKHISKEDILKNYINITTLKKIKDINIDLEKYRLWVRVNSYDETVIIEILSDDLEYLTDFMNEILDENLSERDILDRIETNSNKLIHCMENFEDRINSIRDRYLGTPKEKIEIRGLSK